MIAIYDFQFKTSNNVARPGGESLGSLWPCAAAAYLPASTSPPRAARFNSRALQHIAVALASLKYSHISPS